VQGVCTYLSYPQALQHLHKIRLKVLALVIVKLSQYSNAVEEVGDQGLNHYQWLLAGESIGL
jgi:hypothetical protein